MSSEKVCPECDGKGWVYDPKDGWRIVCPECYGSGKENNT